MPSELVLGEGTPSEAKNSHASPSWYEREPSPYMKDQALAQKLGQCKINPRAVLQ